MAASVHVCVRACVPCPLELHVCLQCGPSAGQMAYPQTGVEQGDRGGGRVKQHSLCSLSTRSMSLRLSPLWDFSPSTRGMHKVLPLHAACRAEEPLLCDWAPPLPGSREGASG